MNDDARARLRETFKAFWEEIRGSKLYAGQPRNKQSAASVNLAQEALRLAGQSGEDEFLIEAWHMLANSLVADEQYQQAISYYKLLIPRLEELGEQARAARIRLGYVFALSHADQFDEALLVASDAAKWLSVHDKEGYARLCTNVGGVYDRVDQRDKAYEQYTTAMKVFKELGNQPAIATLYLNLGVTLSFVDRFEEADAMFEQAEQLSTEVGMNELWVQANYNRAYLYFVRGRYSEALQGFARLREHFSHAGSLRHWALCDLDESEIYLQLNLSKDAATLALRASERFKEIGMAYEESKALARFGAAMMQMRKFGEALDTFLVAQRSFQDQGNEYWVGLLDLYRADVFLSLERYWEARSLAVQAKERFEALGIPSRRMLSLVLLGRIALAMDDVNEAEKHAEQIASITDKTHIPLLLFPYHVLRGQVAERKQQWEKAQSAYQQAVEDLESHHGRIQHDDLRVTFLQERHRVYESLVRLSLLTNPDAVDTAYSWCERAKSRGLIELLSHHLPSVQTRGEQSLLQRVHRLREELNLQYVRAKTETQSNWAKPDFQAVVIKEQELARTLREVRQKDPEYVSLHEVTAASLESVQNFISDDMTVIEYFSTSDEVLAFVISKNGASAFRRLVPPSRLQTLQERLGFQLEKFLLGEDFVKAHSAQILEATTHYLEKLHEALIEPLLPAINTPQLTIIPHGTLHFLPFHSFFDGERYLIDRYEIAYAPSASILQYCMSKPDIIDAKPLIVGVADENAPMVDQEVMALTDVFPEARVLKGEKATRRAFTEAAERSSLLHVATHATFRQDNPMFSNFKLADGYITAFDLFSMNCQTNLASLSGCKSGLSQVSGSDDLLGLMRGFLYAGARSLLLSLWSISDESTVALMTQFYKEWQSGASKPQALQKAMQTVREDYPNPFYWAPFILVGKV